MNEYNMCHMCFAMCWIQEFFRIYGLGMHMMVQLNHFGQLC